VALALTVRIAWRRRHCRKRLQFSHHRPHRCSTCRGRVLSL